MDDAPSEDYTNAMQNTLGGEEQDARLAGEYFFTENRRGT